MKLSSWKTILYMSVSVLLLLANCSGEVQSSLAPVPTAYGPINQLNVISDSTIWNDRIGDSVDFYYASAYPIMPQPEPIFDVRHLQPQQMKAMPAMRELRNYLILADLSDNTSPTTKMVREDISDSKLQEAMQKGYGTTIGRNKWAKGQQLIYIYGNTREELLAGVVNSFPAVAARVQEFDRKSIDATTFFSGMNRDLMDTVQQIVGVEMRIPKEFFLAPLEDTTIVWLREDTPYGSNNIFLSRIPYRSEKQLSKEHIINIRDSLGNYVSTTIPNTYMRVNDEDLPMIAEQTTINGDYALEARGIWEIENDFVGGPFVSYLIYDPNKTDLLFVDAFVHAPGEEKRDKVQALEYIVSTIKY